jgi:hypothetical protein
MINSTDAVEINKSIEDVFIRTNESVAKWSEIFVEHEVKSRTPDIVADDLFCFSGSVAGFRFSGIIEFFAGPQHATGDEVEINIGAHRLVVMTNRSAEDFAFSNSVGPNASMIFLSVFAESGCQWFAVGPHLVDFI